MQPTTSAYERIRSALDAAGLDYTDTGDRIAAQKPGHSGRNGGNGSYEWSFIRTDVGVGIADFTTDNSTDDKRRVLQDLGLDWKDAFDDHKPIRESAFGGQISTRNYLRGETWRTPKGVRVAGAPLMDGPAIDKSQPVYLCEGQTDVYAARARGVQATTNISGAGNAAKADLRPLEGCDVVVVGDTDDAGRRRLSDLSVSDLPSLARSVTYVEPKTGKDLEEHLLRGLGLADLVDVTGDYIERPAREITVTFGHQVEMKPIEWMIDDWMPWGFLTLLAGREGLGKSTIACRIAAERTQCGEHIIYIASEDSIDHVVAPRLRAAGAVMENVMFLNVVTEFSETGTVEFPADLPELEKLVEKHDVRLVVLDAVTSVVSQQEAGDGNNDRRIRSVLEPMAAVAARRNMVMLGLCHFGKKDSSDTGKLMMGSIAWSQVARSVLAVAADEDNGQLVVTNTKSNLARQKRSESVVITTASIEDSIEIGVAEWLGEASTSATDLLGDAEERADRTEAMNWVHDYLSLHPSSYSAEVKREGAKDLGMSAKAIQRAAKKLCVVMTDTKEVPRRTVWDLPPSQDVGPSGVPTVPTVPTGDDLHKQGVPTGSQSGQGVPTGSQSGHDVSPGHAQSGQSGQSGHDREYKCIACSEDLIFADDIADGFHTADRHCLEAARTVTAIPGDVSNSTVGMTDRVAAIIAKNEGIAS